jgi:nucleoside phosphorylase
VNWRAFIGFAGKQLEIMISLKTETTVSQKLDTTLKVEAVLKAAEDHIGDRFPKGKLRNRLLNLGIDEFIQVDQLAVERYGFPFKFNSQLDEAILALAHFLDRLKKDGGTLDVYSLYKPSEGEDKNLGYWQSAKAKLYIELQNLILLLNAVPGRSASINRVLTFRSVTDLAFLTPSAIGVLGEQVSARIKLGFLFLDSFEGDLAVLPVLNTLLIHFTPRRRDNRHNFYAQYELTSGTLRPELPYQERCVSKWFNKIEDAFKGVDGERLRAIKTVFSGDWPSLRDGAFSQICEFDDDGKDMFNSAAVMLFRGFKHHNLSRSAPLPNKEIIDRINETVSTDELIELERAISAFDDEESNIYAIDSSSVKKSLKIHEANPTYRQWLRRGLNSVLRAENKQLRRIYILKDNEDEYQVFLRAMQYYFDYFHFDIPEMTAIVHRHRESDYSDEAADARIQEWLRQKWNSLQNRVHVFITTESALREVAALLNKEDVSLKLSQLFSVQAPVALQKLAFYLSRLDFLYTEKMFYNFLNERADPSLAKYRSYLFREFSDPSNEEVKQREIADDVFSLFNFASEPDLEELVRAQTLYRMKSIVKTLSHLMGTYGSSIRDVFRTHKTRFDEIERRVVANTPDPLDLQDLVQVMRDFESALYNYFRPSFEYFYSLLELASIEIEFFRDTKLQSIENIAPFEECLMKSRSNERLPIDELRKMISDKVSEETENIKRLRIGVTRETTSQDGQKGSLRDPFVSSPANTYFGIITALPKEYVAVEALLTNRREYDAPGPRSDVRYLLGDIPAQGGGKHSIALALLSDMGNNSAAYRTGALLNHFPNVSSVLMVGIAGGVPNPQKPDEHVRLGDIVVSDRNGVVQYDYVKETFVEDTDRHPPRPPGRALLDGVKYLEIAALKGRHPWETFIDQVAAERKIRRPSSKTDILADSIDPSKIIAHPKDPNRKRGRPRVFSGPIGSANNLLKNPVRRDQLRDQFGVKAIEMEGSGIADATWNEAVVYLVVRGICDYCDSKKSDDWQNYAAIVAAAYTRALLEAIPPHSVGVQTSPPGRNVKSPALPGQRSIERGQNSSKGITRDSNYTAGSQASIAPETIPGPSAMPSMKYDVFISYRWISPDQEWVRDQLYQHLLEAGVKVILDVEDFLPGRDLTLEMERAGNESHHVLCVISPEYFEEGRMVEFESLSARRRDPAGRNSFLIPLILRQASIPDRIRGLISIDWTNPKHHLREWKKLLKVLEAKDLSALPPGAA